MMNYEMIENVVADCDQLRKSGTDAWRTKVLKAKQIGMITEEEMLEIKRRMDEIIQRERREEMKEDMMKMMKAGMYGSNYYLDRFLNPGKYFASNQ